MAEWEQLNHVIVQSDSYGAYMPTGGFCHYLERKHGCLVHLGAIGREVLDGTELRDELDGWGPSKRQEINAIECSNTLHSPTFTHGIRGIHRIPWNSVDFPWTFFKKVF